MDLLPLLGQYGIAGVMTAALLWYVHRVQQQGVAREARMVARIEHLEAHQRQQDDYQRQQMLPALLRSTAALEQCTAALDQTGRVIRDLSEWLHNSTDTRPHRRPPSLDCPALDHA